jgi:hypothetical protein
MAAADALAFGTGATVMPLLHFTQAYWWNHVVDISFHRLLHDIELPSNASRPDMAYQLAHDVLALTNALLIGDDIAGVVKYDNLFPHEKQNFNTKWNQWLQQQGFLKAPHITVAKAMWPAAAAGLFAGYTLNVGMTLYGFLRAPDIYLHLLVTYYKHCLIAWRSREQNGDLLTWAVRLAAYAYIRRTQPHSESMWETYTKVLVCKAFTEAFQTIENPQTEDYV